jgi:hypothetical protein
MKTKKHCRRCRHAAPNYGAYVCRNKESYMLSIHVDAKDICNYFEEDLSIYENCALINRERNA